MPFENEAAILQYADNTSNNMSGLIIVYVTFRRLRKTTCKIGWKTKLMTDEWPSPKIMPFGKQTETGLACWSRHTVEAQNHDSLF